MRYRGVILVMVIILCVPILGCSEKEEEKSAAVTEVALEGENKELPRLEQNYVYENSVEEMDSEPFYFHESPDPLTPMPEEEKEKSPLEDTV